MAFLFRRFPSIIKRSVALLRKSDLLILASSTAFFATFSLAPIIIILLNVLSLVYFSSEDVSQKIYHAIQTVFDEKAAQSIEGIVNNFTSFKSHWWITVAGALFLIFVATTLLHIVKQAIHQLWQIKRTSHKLKYSLRERLTSFALILVIGLLFIIAILSDATMSVIKGYIHEVSPSELDVFLIQGLKVLISTMVVTAWFTVLFKVLQDAHVEWRVAIPGGIVTGVLFMLGEFILGKLLRYGNVATIFGTSASIVLILLFIFYSSMIIYFGAAFTYEYANEIDRPIKPRKYASLYEKKLVDVDDENEGEQ